MIQTKQVDYKKNLLKENERYQKSIDSIKMINEARIQENLEKIKNLEEEIVYSKSVLIDEFSETEFVKILENIEFEKLTEEEENKIFEKIDSFERENLKKSLLIIVDYVTENTSMNFLYLMKKHKEILLEIKEENKK